MRGTAQGKEKWLTELEERLARLRGDLMSMVNQFFISNKDGTISHSCMGVEEQAIETLIDEGLAEEVESDGRLRFRLLWDNLR